MSNSTLHFDVFNGDADGIMALVQLRLAQPKESILITGVKRNIGLLAQVVEQLDEQVGSQQNKNQVSPSVTVLDISLEKNIIALNTLLNRYINVFYADHHRTGTIPESDYLTPLLNTDANTCTSLLINNYLEGRYVKWAIAAAFGDNMNQSAQQLAEEIALTAEQTSQLAELGIYVNYNGYGRNIEDLHFHPAQLFQKLVQYADPLTLIAEPNSIFTQLKTAYLHDMSNAQSAPVLFEDPYCKIISLADEAWARRISGVFGNHLTNQSPNKAHAVITHNSDLSYTVSVRAPLNNKQGADEICIQFPSGGGRTGAAGINKLPENQLGSFIQTMSNYYKKLINA